VLAVTVRVTTGGGAKRFAQPAAAMATMTTTAMCAADLTLIIVNFSFPAAPRAVTVDLAANIVALHSLRLLDT
jgi:hypothetical protein